ncbi:hypothetical protein WDJ51_12350 [Rathayibacter sp. YIM 133350]|uniref:hypothetical protein n=1 Tax=Rathayibacter sp. YIM 133350 TaxID=3131992 RepID=UPI00307D06D8
MHIRFSARRIGAASAALLLAGGISLAGALPASADEQDTTGIQLVTSIADHEDSDTYNSWHEGYNSAAGDPVNWTLLNRGIEIKGKSQLITGLGDASLSTDALVDTIEGEDGIAWGADSPINFQLVFGALDSSGNVVGGKFTTLYPDDNTAGYVDLDQVWHSTYPVVGSDVISAPHAAATLADILGALGDNGYSLIGYGVQSNDDGWSTLWGIDFGGAITLFAQPALSVPSGLADSDAVAAAIAHGDLEHHSAHEVGLPDSIDPTKPFTATIDTDGDQSISDLTVYDVWAFSTPTLIGSFVTDRDGVLTIHLTTAQLSQLGAGDHTLLLWSRDANQFVAISFAIAARTNQVTGVAAVTTTAARAALAETGFDAGLPLALAGGLFALGIGAFAVKRRVTPAGR